MSMKNIYKVAKSSYTPNQIQLALIKKNLSYKMHFFSTLIPISWLDNTQAQPRY